MKYYLTLFFLIAQVVSFCQKTIDLVEPRGKAFIIYRNKNASIKFLYKDVIDEIEIIKTTTWYGDLTYYRKERIEKALFKLRSEYDTYTKSNQNKGRVLFRVLESEYYGGDSLLVTMLKRSAGASILLKGKALIRKKESLKIMNPILAECSGDDSCKFFFDSGEEFFKGSLLKRGHFINEQAVQKKLSLNADKDLEKIYSESLFNEKKITGRIFEKNTGNSIKGAKIKLSNSKYETKTDSLGYFEIDADSINTLIIETKYHEPYMQKVPVTHNLIIHLKRIVGEEIYEPNKFPGGLNRFYEYVNKNLTYPKDAFAKRIEGKVLVKFVIDSTGSVLPNEIKVVRSLHKSCDEEAIRVIRESPKWLPMYFNGKAISWKETLYIQFKIK